MTDEYERRIPSPEKDELVKESKWMRNMIWWLLGGIATGFGGWAYQVIVMQAEMNEIKNKQVEFSASIKELKQSNKLLIEINTVVKIVSEDVKKLTVSQQVFGREQARRTQTIIDARNHMKNRGLHR